MKLPTITGTGPVGIKFNDGSESVFELTDPVFLSAIAYGDRPLEAELFTGPSTFVETDAAEDSTMVDFAWLEWPSDAHIVLGEVEITVQEASDRFGSFLTHALRRAVQQDKIQADSPLSTHFSKAKSMEIEKELVYKICFSDSDDEFIASVNTDPALSFKDDTPNAALKGLRELLAKKLD